MAEDDFKQRWQLSSTLRFISSRRLHRIALQFPDELLKDAVAVARELQRRCDAEHLDAQVFLLADTTYNPLGVDEVAAAHADADAVVHYGRASLSPLSRLPAFFVFGREPLDVPACARRLAAYAAAPLNPEGLRAALVFLDQPLLWALPELRRHTAAHAAEQPAEGRLPIVFAEAAASSLEPQASGSSCQRPACSTSCPGSTEAAANAAADASEQLQTLRLASEGDSTEQGQQAAALAGEARQGPLPEAGQEGGEAGASGRDSLAGYSWRLPEGVELEEAVLIWVGPAEGAPALQQLQLAHSNLEWASLDPAEGRWQHGVPLEVTKGLRRRYYLVEKARNASIVGIIVGTLGVAGFLAAAEKVRDLARAAGKKTYTLLMGKPSPAKLANFPEVEVFVLVADPQGQILDSKEFYAPIITPHEAQLAFGGGQWGASPYTLDFQQLLQPGISASGDPSAGREAEEPRFSLLDGRYHDSGPASAESPSAKSLSAESTSRELAVGPQAGALQRVQPGPGHLAEVTSAAGFLQHRRSYRGLETPSTGAERLPAALAVAGRTGRAAQYEGEQ